MKILIKDIQNGAEYEDKVFDFWLRVQLHNGREIKVFDFVPFDMRNYVMQHSECLILAGFLESPNSSKEYTTIKGTLINYDVILEEWSNIRDDIKHQNWFGVQTDDGVFLINPCELSKAKVKLGEMIEYSVGRFDLVAVK